MILGAVLAGGRSSRFGSDKALALWQGIPLIEHVIGRLRRVCSEVIVCGRAHGDFPTVSDWPRADLGPLGGLAAALRYAQANGFDCVMSAPCDVPSISDQLLAALAEARPDSFVHDMPVIGLWNNAGASRLVDHLGTEADRSMRAWARLVGATALPLASPQNINHPDDLDQMKS